MYRPLFSDHAVNSNINESLIFAKRLFDDHKFTNLILVGEFNHLDIRFSDTGGICIGNGRPASLEFLNTLSDNFLSQFVYEPTFKSIFIVNVCPPLGSTNKMKLHSTLFFKFILKDIRPTTSNPSNFFLIKKGNNRNQQIIKTNKLAGLFRG